LANKSSESAKESIPCVGALLDSEPTQQPTLPTPPYKPYTEEPAAPEHYRPYAEKPESEPPYEPYKGI